MNDEKFKRTVKTKIINEKLFLKKIIYYDIINAREII